MNKWKMMHEYAKEIITINNYFNRNSCTDVFKPYTSNVSKVRKRVKF